MYFYFICSSFLLGISLSFKFNLINNTYLSVVLFLFLIFIYLITENKIKTLIIFLIILFFSIGIIRVSVFENNFKKIYKELVGKYIESEAIISEFPDNRESVVHYVLYIDEYDVFIRATCSHYPTLNYGDKILIKGKLDIPKNFTNQKTGITFDYINYLKKDRISYVMFFPKTELIERNYINDKENKFLKIIKIKLSQIKKIIESSINKSLPAPHSSLALGILIGSKQALGKDLLEAFQIVGLIHIVVLSGYNVTIIVDFVIRVLGIFPRNISIILSIICIILFAILTGASATTVRASIMAIISVIAIALRRKYSVHRALFLAGMIMVFENPYILFYDPGFQLSFVATMGLLYVSPKIEFLLEKIKVSNFFTIRETLATTVATQIAVLPLLINMMGYVSIVSLLANLLVLPVIPIAMASSAIAGLTYWAGNLFLPIQIISYWLLEYVFWITTNLAKVPWAVWYF